MFVPFLSPIMRLREYFEACAAAAAAAAAAAVEAEAVLLLGGRAAGGGSAPLPAPPQHNTKSVHVVNRRLKNSACTSFKS